MPSPAGATPPWEQWGTSTSEPYNPQEKLSMSHFPLVLSINSTHACTKLANAAP